MSTSPATRPRRGSLGERLLLTIYAVTSYVTVADDDPPQARAALAALRTRRCIRFRRDGTYAITPAGRAALGLPARRGRRDLASAVATAVRCFIDPDRVWEPFIDVHDPAVADPADEYAGAVLAEVHDLPTDRDHDVYWAAVAQYVSDAGFPCYVLNNRASIALVREDEGTLREGPQPWNPTTDTPTTARLRSDRARKTDTPR